MLNRLRPYTPDLGIIVGLFLLPLLFFAPVTLGGRTLIPADNLYQYEPWASARVEQKVPEIPHNALLSDLIFQNYQWKTFLRQSINNGEIPLWQPNQFSGTPFLANGQHSAYYPFSLIYYILPLETAYGWFTVSQLWLAGMFMYFLIRGLGLSRMAGVVAGVSYQLSSFMIVSTVHPMIQAGAAWLPFLILMLEFILQGRVFISLGSESAFWRGMPWVLLGGIGLGLNFLAGHIEITYYTLMIMAIYAAGRLGVNLWQQRKNSLTARGLTPLLVQIIQLWLLVGIGFGLGAAQFIPLAETANQSFRTERSALDEVLGYALPPRHILLWVLPNFYGNPAHHNYWDVFEGKTVAHDWLRPEADGQQTRITNTDFGIKNYVEGGAYIGILPLLLAILGLFSRGVIYNAVPYRIIFGGLGILAGLFMFGTPAYAVFYHLFPAVDQLHTPFRWVWVFTFVLCIFAAYGVEHLDYWSKRTRYIVSLQGGLLVAGLMLHRIFYESLAAPVERLYDGLAGANLAFPNAEAFYSYQFRNGLILGLLLLGSGLVFHLYHRQTRIKNLPVWGLAAIGLMFIDMWLATGDFNPRSKTEWLNYEPPAITWLAEQQTASLEQGEGGFRIQSFNWGEDPLVANTGWQYGLFDVRGYDSLFSKQYADFMGRIAPQTGLAFNRINPIFYDQPQALLSPELDLLNVRYIITDWIIRPQEEFGISDLTEVGLKLVYEDAGVRIYENLDALPAVYAVPLSAVDADHNLDLTEVEPAPATVTVYESSTVFTDIRLENPSWLIFSGTYADGWRAFIRPIGEGDAAEREIEVEKIAGNFRAVTLENGDWTIRWRYSPTSFQLGAFTSFITGMVVIFLGLLWFWQTFVGESADQDSSRRVIKNSLAPIILNLFNRGIDFAFAFIMLRILAPEGAGIYYYAIVVFGWFDILTNFGLNTLLTREVARDRSKAGLYLLNTTALRFGLAGLGVFVLGIFLVLRNALVSPKLDETALVAIGLLYLGLLPSSLSTGLTALFYAFEKAEYPAALATVTTLIKVTLGLGALLLGWGVIGLAGVSILTNIITMSLMLRLALPLLRQVTSLATGQISSGLMRGMMGESYPLMINHLLATVFFKSDVILMEAINGAVIVGVYSTAYKWLDALNIIPAFFTMALLPMMSRQAHEDRAALTRNYVFGFKSLLLVALPTAVFTTFAAPTLIGVLGGQEFLPEGGIALQIMIWSILIGWINSLTQYVLIALDRQRAITGAFIVAVSFNVIANLIFLPQYCYRAAATTTILSELVLLVGFYRLLQVDLGRINYLGVLWKPILAAGMMLLAMLILWNINGWLAILGGFGVYGLGLIFLNPLTPEESERLGRILPTRFKKTSPSVVISKG